MRVQRRRDGRIFVMEAWSQDAHALDQLHKGLPGSYIQWDSDGVPVRDETGEIVSSGPAFVLWRPDIQPRPEDELEDLAELLTAPTPPQPVAAAPDPPLPEPPPTSEDEAEDKQSFVAPRKLRPHAPHKNLTRIDHPAKRTHGYMVRIRWKRQLYQKFFSDKQHGDRLGALAAAIAWRDATERELEKPRSDALVIGAGGSNTGILGITRTTAGDDPVFQVTWYEDGRQRRRKFNIRILGEKQALREAIRARKQAEKERLARGRQKIGE